MSFCVKPKGEVAESKKNINLFDWEKDLSRLWVKDLEDAPLNKLSKFWDQPGFPFFALNPMREALNKLQSK